MKRFVSLLCLAALVVAMFAGCGSTAPAASSAPASSSAAASTEASATPAPAAAPEEINVMVWDRGNNKFSDANMTVADNALTRYIQEQVLASKNVKVTYVASPRSGSDDKVNAMMAGGNAPDLILTYSRDVFGNFATQGGLTDLTSLLQSDGQNILKYIGKETLDVGVLDGKQFAIMTRRGIQVARHTGYIRKDWLDKLGLAVPKTNEELIAALYAFKEKDPGGLGDKNIPWGMGGVTDTEMFYLSYVNQYITKPYEGENLWTYQEFSSIMNPEAKAGFAAMNKMYNDGIISKDFAVDTKNDKFIADVSNGYVGFTLMDSFAIPGNGWDAAAKEKAPDAKYVPVKAFTGVNGEFKNPAEPTYGTYIMVPKKSEAKAAAVVRYLDWLADPVNAQNVRYTPTQTTDADGLPVGPTEEDNIAKNYPATPDDLNILNKHFAFMDEEAKVIASFAWMKSVAKEDLPDMVRGSTTDMIVYPVQQALLPNSSKYGKAVQDACLQMAYKCISAPADQFEATYASEFQKVMQAGFDKILAEKQDYYTKNVKK